MEEKFLVLGIIVAFYACAPYSSVFKVNNLFDKLESLKQGWVMSHVVRDVKFLESPFPRGSRAEWMLKSCCLSRRQNSVNFYQVIWVLGSYFFLSKDCSKDIKQL